MAFFCSLSKIKIELFFHDCISPIKPIFLLVNFWVWKISEFWPSNLELVKRNFYSSKAFQDNLGDNKEFLNALAAQLSSSKSWQHKKKKFNCNYSLLQ
jgi:hypothetical protein